MKYEKKIRTLIVDDETLAREKVERLLDQETDIDVVGKCANGLEAIASIEDQKPDLVFLDIEMPGIGGFEVLQNLSPEVLPIFVFVTAYSEYAVNAFEINALDYLLKPFDRERLVAAVERVREQLKFSVDVNREKRIESLLASLGAEKEFSERIVVKDDGRIHLIKTKQIDWIEAAGNYVKLHIGRSAYMLRETMKRLEDKLNPEKFIRIHRSTLVNIDRITELHPLFSGDYSVVLEDKTELSMSRHYQKRLRELI